jgi:hypothetical protein
MFWRRIPVAAMEVQKKLNILGSFNLDRPILLFHNRQNQKPVIETKLAAEFGTRFKNRWHRQRPPNFAFPS